MRGREDGHTTADEKRGAFHTLSVPAWNLTGPDDVEPTASAVNTERNVNPGHTSQSPAIMRHVGPVAQSAEQGTFNAIRQEH